MIRPNSGIRTKNPKDVKDNPNRTQSPDREERVGYAVWEYVGLECMRYITTGYLVHIIPRTIIKSREQVTDR
jgi:hypothetical protein